MSDLNLSPQVLNLVLYAGDGVNFRLTVTDSNDDPVPLIGTMEAQIRLTRASADPPVAEFTIDLTDAANGIALLSLDNEDTKVLLPTAPAKKFIGVWDLQWAPTDEQPRTLCQGKVVCIPDVSR